MKLFTLHLILALYAASSPLQAQLTVEFDLSNTHKTLEILKRNHPNESSLKELVDLQSSKALLKKLSASDSVMLQALKKSYDSTAQTTRQESYFQYRMIRENLKELSAFVDTLQVSSKVIEEKLQKALEPYLPPEKNVSIKIVGITGGHSTGYTFGDKDTFYISMHHMKNDMDYFLFICKHELFHNLQALWYDHDTPVSLLEKYQEDTPDFGTYYVLLSLYTEGTATYLDDIDHLKPSEANRIWTMGQEKNKSREKYIFWLFDQTIVSLQNDFSNASLNKAYGTFFLTTYDQQGYYIGALLTAYLLRKQPQKTLQDYMVQSPLAFIIDYLDISKKDSEAPYHFSEKFGTIVHQLRTKVRDLLKK